MILRACTVCGRLSQGHRCPAHIQRDRRPSAHKRGYTARWATFARSYLKDHPWCEHPQGCTELATQVHHLDGLGPNGPQGFDPTNLQALCHTHHSQTTADLQPGGFNA
jgi:5-methylcytosine-specific restriction protein A